LLICGIHQGVQGSGGWKAVADATEALVTVVD
jgi:hypothetical protein